MAQANGPAAPQSMAGLESGAAMSDWLNRAMADGVKPEQALAFVGLGLMQRLGQANEAHFTSLENEASEGKADLQGLRRRLELTDLAIRTGAPLSTAEVTALLGARPGSAVVERGGLLARRVSRNVWKLSRSSEGGERNFGDAFRRRL